VITNISAKDDPPVFSKEFFLETSIQIKKIFGHKLHRNEIKHTIAGASCWSSFFILGEFKRSVINALIDFYFLLDEEETPSEALRALSEKYSTRDLKFDISAFASLIEDEEFKNNKTRCLIKLERIIENALDAFIFNTGNGKNFIENKIGCPIGKVPLKVSDEYSLKENYKIFKDNISCCQDMGKCETVSFWKNNRSFLKYLLDPAHIAKYKDNKAYQSFLESYGKLQEDIKMSGGRNCLKLSDTIIAIECPGDKILLTLDKSFEALCGILKKNYFRIPSLVELKKRIEAKE
jgi:hypothetical protein